MASIIFGVGTSPTPMLNAAAEEWPLMEELDRRRLHLHKDGRRATYDELLSIEKTGVSKRENSLLKSALLGIAAFGLAIAGVPAQAQTYPDHVVKIVIGLPPGVGFDVLVPGIAQELSTR